MDIATLQAELARFARDRDWEQFHSPKNLVMALAGESGELLEIFQWLTEQQSSELSEGDKAYARARDEIADIQIYLLRLADRMGVDLETAVREKIDRNARKYPVELSRGHATKYTDL